MLGHQLDENMLEKGTDKTMFYIGVMIRLILLIP